MSNNSSGATKDRKSIAYLSSDDSIIVDKSVPKNLTPATKPSICFGSRGLITAADRQDLYLVLFNSNF